MKVAIASGKGGTGKTTLATSLAYVASARGNRVAYLDCDVEEPNGHLFLKPRIREQRPIEKLVPAVDSDRCTHCGRCGASCRFGAIVCVGKQTLIFSELCHGCGACVLACPEEAIVEMRQPIGQLLFGSRGSLEFVGGVLNVGEAMSPPAIRAVKDAAPDSPLTILDCPPGTSCPVIESVRGCDLLVLVTEPTPFGMHDLQLAVELARALRLNFGVVINRSDAGDRAVWDYCRQQRIPILAEIPDDRAVAEAYSQGRVAAESVPHVARCAERLLATLESGVLA